LVVENLESSRLSAIFNYYELLEVVK